MSFASFLALPSTQDNRPLYALALMYYYHLVPYVHLRAAIGAGHTYLVLRLMRYFVHVFIATNKIMYARGTLKFLYMIQALDDSVCKLALRCMIIDFNTSAHGRFVALDFVNEVYQDYMRDAVHQGVSRERIITSSTRVNGYRPIVEYVKGLLDLSKSNATPKKLVCGLSLDMTELYMHIRRVLEGLSPAQRTASPVHAPWGSVTRLRKAPAAIMRGDPITRLQLAWAKSRDYIQEKASECILLRYIEDEALEADDINDCEDSDDENDT
eukprot:TRINITY_DN1933_c0_g1_i3.p1 TRINITY_DN1933_c0_g1~~TRINITY_DN1933_c0_g1_i3.p1  ORF type:complete len:269 (+),score=57.44 TRINITY_DN1933_c0_g1_i3:921-1727(+)